MPSPEHKHHLSVQGKYFVDAQECQECRLCTDIASGHFQLIEKERVAYVAKQPASPEEDALCEEAMECCPTGAIGIWEDVKPNGE